MLVDSGDMSKVSQSPYRHLLYNFSCHAQAADPQILLGVKSFAILLDLDLFGAEGSSNKPDENCVFSLCFVDLYKTINCWGYRNHSNAHLPFEILKLLKWTGRPINTLSMDFPMKIGPKLDLPVAFGIENLDLAWLLACFVRLSL